MQEQRDLIFVRLTLKPVPQPVERIVFRAACRIMFRRRGRIGPVSGLLSPFRRQELVHQARERVRAELGNRQLPRADDTIHAVREERDDQLVALR